MGRHYVNAREVLPGALLQAVCDAVGGRPVFMWIPGRRNLNKDERDRHVLALHAQGYPVSGIADRVFLSERTVWRILARARVTASKVAGTAAAPEDCSAEATAVAG